MENTHSEKHTCDVEVLQGNILNQLQKDRKYVVTMEAFELLKSDAERVDFVYHLPVVKHNIHIESFSDGKSSEQSEVLRNQGNNFFQKKDYKKALKLYTESILKAPTFVTDQPEQCSVEKEKQENDQSMESTVLLATAYSNRSAALFYLKQYEACLVDISLAFKYGYPNENHYKLYERQGKCYLQLKCKEHSLKAFENAIHSLEKSALSNMKSENWKSSLVKQCELSRKLMEENAKICASLDVVNNFHTELPVIPSHDKNSTFLSATSAVGLIDSVERGHGLMAMRDIDVGEVVVIEKPYSSVVLGNQEITYCHHCCNRVVSPVPCQQCSNVTFCGYKCRKEAWNSYHRTECKVLRQIHKAKSKLGHLALRMVIKAGFAYLMQYKSRNVIKDEVGYSEDGKYDSDDYHAVYTLVKHTDKRSPEDLFRRAINAVYFLKCLELTNFFDLDENTVEISDRIYIGGHILRHIQMLPCNAHEVSDMHWKLGGEFQSETIEVGSGAYALLSLINHSCDPSVVRHSYGNTIVVRTIKRISKGEELLDNYGALYPLTIREERRKILNKQYYFECNCEACQADYPLYFDISDDSPIFVCEECGGPVFVPENKVMDSGKCSNCKQSQSLTHKTQALEMSRKKFTEALENVLNDKKMEESERNLVRHLSLINRYICLPWREFNNCQEAVKHCFAVKANCYKIQD